MHDQRDVMGTGIPIGPYCAIIAVATVAFLFWGGPLWDVPPDASHLGRIVGTYAVIVPLTAIALLVYRTFNWVRWITAMGTAWAIKLVVTATLFSILSSGTDLGLEPRALPEISPEKTARAGMTARYKAATGEFLSATLRGLVTAARLPTSHALVVLQKPSPGRATIPQDVSISIENARYDGQLFSVKLGDRLQVTNKDRALHTLHLHADERASTNLPLPGGGERTVRVPHPGTYRISCDNHDTERGWLVVVDHPYATRTDPTGAFAFDAVPLGEYSVQAFQSNDGSLASGDAIGTVGGESSPAVTIDIAAPGGLSK